MTPRPAAPDPAREDERQQKLAALRARLHEDAQALRTPGDWAARLRLAALHAGRGLREHPAHLRPAARRHHGPGLPAMDRGRTAGPPGRKGHRDLRRPAPPAPGRPQDRTSVTTTSRRRAGGMPTGSPTSGTCRRPPASPAPSRPGCPRPARPRRACGTRCAGWPAARDSPSSTSTAPQPTAPPSGPPAASGSCPA